MTQLWCWSALQRLCPTLRVCCMHAWHLARCASGPKRRPLRMILSSLPLPLSPPLQRMQISSWHRPVCEGLRHQEIQALQDARDSHAPNKRQSSISAQLHNGAAMPCTTPPLGQRGTAETHCRKFDKSSPHSCKRECKLRAGNLRSTDAHQVPSPEVRKVFFESFCFRKVSPHAAFQASAQHVLVLTSPVSGTHRHRNTRHCTTIYVYLAFCKSNRTGRRLRQ